jgi:Protein of unknown function (DUF3443)/HYDIN/CFA65/VesB-like, Ig-like domain
MSVNLGSVKVGGAPASRTITIKNTGRSDLAISSITLSGTNASEFSYSPANGCPDPVPAKGLCPVAVTFTPTFPFGKKSATISISSNDLKKQTVSVKLSGQAPPPRLSAAPKAVNFSTVNIGNTSGRKTVTIKNTGVSDLLISDISFTGTNPQDFYQTNNCSVIAKGSSCTINITFIPSQPDSKESASLIISSDDPKKPAFSVKLSGRGDRGTTPTDSNVMTITVNGSLCSNNSYLNKPCVSVTVCTPGTTTCQTIDDILLDTGSSGLRIFQQALSVPLTPEDSGGIGSFAECIQYADGSSDWGPVQIASVILGNEPAVEVPIQVIDSTFGTLPSACRNADQSQADAGFNGILGVGLFAEDCGQYCSNTNSNGMYYVCSGSDCQGTAVPLSSQVRNPVALLPQDNNGVIVELPDVPLGGVPSVDGHLVLGIGTRTNNVPSAVTTYPADQYGEFTTDFNGNYSSFLDTGSNGLFFPPPPSNMLPGCAYPNSGWFCPSSTQSFSAIDTGSTGSPSGTVSFSIGNFDSLTSSSNNVFSEIGGNEFSGFDWGLPFHFGRNVYIGLEGTESSLGSGTYWAY